VEENGGRVAKAKREGTPEKYDTILDSLSLSLAPSWLE